MVPYLSYYTFSVNAFLAADVIFMTLNSSCNIVEILFCSPKNPLDLACKSYYSAFLPTFM